MPPTAMQDPSTLTQREPDRTGTKVQGVKDWKPPHTREDLVRIVERLRAGLPVDAAFDDIDAVLGGGPEPNDSAVEDLTERLRGSLMVLVDSVQERRPGDPEQRDRMVERARELRTAEPGPGATPRTHLRRLALSVQDLLELLLPDEEDLA